MTWPASGFFSDDCLLLLEQAAIDVSQEAFQLTITKGKVFSTIAG